MNESQARHNLNRLFDELKADGFATIEGNICCRTCATAQLNNEHPDGTPCAYYTVQDVEDGRGDPLLTNVYVGYGPIGMDDGEKTRAVGDRIVLAAGRAGVPVEWSGDPVTRILVNPVRED